MKVTVHESLSGRVAIGDMPTGSLGVCEKGFVYFRTASAAACLNDVNSSYNSVSNVTVKVRLLPRGTKVTLEVG